MKPKKVKIGKVVQGEHVTFEGVEYVVLSVHRGEGQARTASRMGIGAKFYRVVRGQWAVLKMQPAMTPEYFNA